MKKKFLAGLAIVLLILGLAGMANADTFTDLWNPQPDPDLGKGSDPNSGIYSWTHLTPSDFEVPWDTVNSATLMVSISFLENGVNTGGVFVETINFGDIESWFIEGSSSNNKTYTADIGSVFLTWTIGGELHVSLNWSTPDTDIVYHPAEYKPNGELKKEEYTTFTDNSFKFRESLFTLNYTNGSAPPLLPPTDDNGTGGLGDPVPEPTTLLLLGIGLAGVAVINLRKARKN
jgi:hypothetical protein